jgi:hypothetical protein
MSKTRTVATAGALLLACTWARALAQKSGHIHKEERHFKVTPPASIKEAWSLTSIKVKDAEHLLASKQTEAVHEHQGSPQSPSNASF